MYETKSATYINDFIAKLDVSQTEYTEFVVVGGDGVFAQLINAITEHPHADALLKLPIGFIPGGSTNALSCSLGGQNPLDASMNIMRGGTVEGDMFKVTFDENDKPVYASTSTFGFLSDVVAESEVFRATFGSNRYILSGAKKYVILQLFLD